MYYKPRLLKNDIHTTQKDSRRGVILSSTLHFHILPLPLSGPLVTRDTVPEIIDSGPMCITGLYSILSI